MYASNQFLRRSFRTGGAESADALTNVLADPNKVALLNSVLPPALGMLASRLAFEIEYSEKGKSMAGCSSASSSCSLVLGSEEGNSFCPEVCLSQLTGLI